MIAFSTQPGNVALDGEGRNSPFTGALAKTYKKTVTPRPYRPKAAARPVPGPRGHRGGDGVGDEQRELQRAFPSTNWPGSR
jgi:hypothetical protein